MRASAIGYPFLNVADMAKTEELTFFDEVPYLWAIIQYLLNTGSLAIDIYTIVGVAVDQLDNGDIGIAIYVISILGAILQWGKQLILKDHLEYQFDLPLVGIFYSKAWTERIIWRRRGFMGFFLDNHPFWTYAKVFRYVLKLVIIILGFIATSGTVSWVNIGYVVARLLWLLIGGERSKEFDENITCLIELDGNLVRMKYKDVLAGMTDRTVIPVKLLEGEEFDDGNMFEFTTMKPTKTDAERAAGFAESSSSSERVQSISSSSSVSNEHKSESNSNSGSASGMRRPASLSSEATIASLAKSTSSSSSSSAPSTKSSSSSDKQSSAISASHHSGKNGTATSTRTQIRKKKITGKKSPGKKTAAKKAASKKRVAKATLVGGSKKSSPTKTARDKKRKVASSSSSSGTSTSTEAVVKQARFSQCMVKGPERTGYGLLANRTNNGVGVGILSPEHVLRGVNVAQNDVLEKTRFEFVDPQNGATVDLVLEDLAVSTTNKALAVRTTSTTQATLMKLVKKMKPLILPEEPIEVEHGLVVRIVVGGSAPQVLKRTVTSFSPTEIFYNSAIPDGLDGCPVIAKGAAVAICGPGSNRATLLHEVVKGYIEMGFETMFPRVNPYLMQYDDRTVTWVSSSEPGTFWVHEKDGAEKWVEFNNYLAKHLWLQVAKGPLGAMLMRKNDANGNLMNVALREDRVEASEGTPDAISADFKKIHEGTFSFVVPRYKK